MDSAYFNSTSAVNAYTNSNPFISAGGGSYGAYGTYTAGTGAAPKAEKPVFQQQQQELQEVYAIGAKKAANFANGLGATNDPDNHKVFYAA